MNKTQAKKNLDQAQTNLYKAEGDYLKSNGWELLSEKDARNPVWGDPIICSDYYCTHTLALKRQLAREV